MDCPKCGYDGKEIDGKKQSATRVTNTVRETENVVWRRRVCRRCGYAFGTREGHNAEAKSPLVSGASV